MLHLDFERGQFPSCLKKEYFPMGQLVRSDRTLLSVRLQDSINSVKTQAVGRWLGGALLGGLAMLAGVRPATAQTAHYAGATTTLMSGFNAPFGVAVDASGNVFVADSTNSAVKEVLAGTGGAAAGTINASSTVNTVGSGFAQPVGVAVDASGNVFVADPDHNAVKEIVAGTGSAGAGTVNASSTVNTVGHGFAQLAGVAVDAHGNVFVADSYAVKEIVAGTGGAAAGTVNASSTVNMLATIFSFNDPHGIAVDASGNVFVADSLNNAVEEIVANTGGAGAGKVNASSTVNAVGSGFNIPTGVAVDASGNVFVADRNNNAVKEVVAGTGSAGAGTVNYSSTVIALGSGIISPQDVALDASGDLFVVNFGSSLNEIQSGAANFGSVNVGVATPPTQTLTFAFDTGGKLMGGMVLAIGQDYANTNTGTCDTNGASHTYAAGDTCTVVVRFSPKAPGQRLGAVQLLNNGGIVIATVHLTGFGLGPVVAYPNPSTYVYLHGMGPVNTNDFGISTVLGTTDLNARGAAVDSAGNFYIGDTYTGVVRRVAANTGAVAGQGPINYNSSTTTLGSGFVGPEGLAIDGVGNVYVADPASTTKVKKIVAVNGYVDGSSSVVGVGSGFGNVHHIAADANGNLWVADTDNNAVKEILAGTDGSVNASSTVVTVGSGFTSPYGIMVDPNGNVFVSDTSGVKEIVAGSNGATINTINSTFGQYSGGLTMDTNGDLFVGFASFVVNSDVAEKIVADANGSLSASSTVSPIYVSGGSGPSWDVAASSDGSLFTLDQPGIPFTGAGYSILAYIDVISYGSAPTLTFPSTLDGTTSQPLSVSIVNSGNAPLIFTIPGSGTNPSTSTTDFTLDTSSATTCPVMTTASTVPGTLAVGATCTISLKFTPAVTDSPYPVNGQLHLVDNAAVTTQTVQLTGTAMVPTPEMLKFTTPPPANLAVGGNAGTVVVSITDYAGHLATTAPFGLITLYVFGPTGTATYSQYANGGVATFDLSGVPQNTAYQYEYYVMTAIVAADTNQPLTSAYAYENVVGTSFTAPTTATGTPSAAQTATIVFSSTYTLNSTLATAIQVLTMGAPNLDFAYATGGTCSPGQTYTSGQSCTVNYTFTPKYPGQRNGAILLYDNSATPVRIATIYLSGSGTGPMVTFPSNTTTTTLGGGMTNAKGVAVDGAGNVFVADLNSATVKQMPAGCASSSCVTTLGGGFAGPFGVAVDGAGNVYVADSGSAAVKEMPAGCASSTCVTTLNGGFTHPYGVAVDGAGNVYVADFSGNAVKEMPAGCSNSSCVTTLGGGFSSPIGIAVDSAGNVFVADFSNNAVKKIPAGCASSSCVTTRGGGFSYPTGVSVDSAGNVFVAGYMSAAVQEMPSGCSSSSCVTTLGGGFSYPFGVVVDGAGNVFVGDSGTSTLYEIPLATVPSLNFASTTDGQTSAAKVVTVANSGNAALSFPIPTTGNDPSIANYFTLGTGGSACPVLTTSSPAAATLASGATCTLTVSFAPTGTISGSVSGSLNLTDNSLNGTNALQAISLSGTAAAANPVATQVVFTASLSLNQATTSFTPITGSGGTAPLTYSISPALPAGLSFSTTTGAITGTPTAVSSAKTYTVTVTDANSLTGSNSFQLNVSALNPQLYLSASVASPSHVNTLIPFTAQLSGVALTPVHPTGTVSFLINGSASPDCPAVTISAAGAATCNTASLTTGVNQTVVATYSGDSNFFTATSATANQTVTAQATTLGLSASPSSSTMVGASVTFTAQLAGTLTPVLPLGKVNFTANGSTITGCGAVSVNATGLATCATSTLVAGSDPITATYSGDSNFTVAAAGTATQTVTATTTTASTNATTSYSPSAQIIGLSAGVVSGSGPVNVGSFTFSVFNGATQIGASVTSGTVSNGSASAFYTVPAGTAAAPYSIHAVYNASAPFATSSDTTHTLTVAKSSATTINLGSLAQTYTGSPLAATSTTTPASLAVTYSYVGTGGTVYGPSATAPTLAGSYTVTATINDSNYSGSNSGTLVIIKATPSLAAITWPTASAITYGQTLASSTLSGGASTPAGGFAFTAPTTAPVAGTAAQSVTFTPTDTADYNTVTSTVSVAVNKATATAFALGSLTQTYANLSLPATAATTPSGLAVTYSYSGTSNGGVTYGPSATAPTLAGSYTVTATINDSNYQGTVTGTLTIGKATPTNLALGTSANPALVGPVTLTATITSSVGAPSGTVSFMDGSSTTPLLGQGTLSGNLAALSISTLTAGSHNITAVYAGDANFVGLSSSVLPQSILDFSVNPGTSSVGGSAAITSQTVEPGGAVAFTLGITPTIGQTFPVPVTLTVTGMPAGATATVTPSTWSQLTGTSWSFPANTPLNAITLTVQVPSTTAKAGGLGRTLAPFSLALLLLPFAGRMRRAGYRMGRLISLLLLLMIGAAAMTALSGCGSTNGYFGQPLTSYTITATATAGNVSRSTNLTLTVQ